MSRCIRRGLLCPLLAMSLVAALVPWNVAPASAQTTTDSGKRWTGAVRVPERTEPDYVEGEVLVKFKAGVGPAAALNAHKTVGATQDKTFKAVVGLELAKLKKGMTVDKAVAAYEAMPVVEYAQPNYRIKLSATIPDDTLFDSLWALNNTGQVVEGTTGTVDADIDAPEAWDVTTGNSDVVVAVIDTGIDYDHPDLNANVWVNAAEVPDNDVDDDGNGWVDDVYGVDTVNEDSDPMDDYGHGTHCSGTIGGIGDNGLGVAGVNWDVSIMAVKTFDAGGWGTTEDILEGFAYAEAEGASVFSCSWGGYEEDMAMYDAIANAPDTLFVVAAGNDSADIDGEAAAYPAEFDLTNILTVGATDANDNPAWFSNYGATSVDVFAPGDNILSTVPGVRTLEFNDELTYTTLFSEDFTTMDNWTSSDPAHPWALTTEHYVSAPTSIARLGYGNDEASYVDCSIPVDLSAASAPWLVLELGGNVEMYVDVAVAGVYDASEAKYKTLTTFYEMSTTGFVTQYVDLSAYIGQDDLYLWFGLQSDSSMSSADGYEGVWIDDVRVIDIDQSLATLFSDDFSTGLNKWDATQYNTSQWTYDPAVGSTGAGSASIVNYAPNEWSRMMMTEPIDLSDVGATLSYDALYDLEEWFDGVIVFATTDGGASWDYVDEFTGLSGTGDTMEWEHHTTSLAYFAGHDSVQVGFILMSDNVERGRGVSRGVWIDDVNITLSPWVPGEPDYSNAYQWAYGTSMATPHVTGIAALLLSQEPGLSVADIKAAIMDTVDVKENLIGLCVTGGRVNAATALFALGNEAPVAVDDEYASEQGVELVVEAPGILTNDTDAETDPLTASLVTRSTAGTVELDPDGSFTYTPDPAFYGEDTFTYRVGDGIESSNDATVTIAVAPKSVVEDTSVGLTFDRFVPSTSLAYSDGTYVYGRWSGARLDARFTGTKVRWIGPKQPGYGMADVYIDNVKIATVDCYAADVDKTLSAVIFESGTLADEQHTISVRLTGAKNPASTGYVVVLDEFEVIGQDATGGAYRGDDSEADFSGTWINGFNSTYVGGGYSYSRWPGAALRYTFLGTKIAWIGPRTHAYGRAQVWIDGIYRATVSQYGATAWRYRVWESMTLAEGVHTVEIRPLGTKDRAATAANVVVDAFDVTP